MTQSDLIKCTLILVIAVAIFNQRLWLLFKSKASFNRLLSVSNLYVGFHASFVLVVEHFFLQYPLYDRLAPFSLMYGPFLYFAFFIIHHQHIKRGKLLLHCSPFLLFSLVYIMLVIFDLPWVPVELYVICFFPTTILSFAGYIIWAVFCNSKPIKNQLKQHKLVVIIAVIVLLFAAMVMSAGIFSNGANRLINSESLLRFLIYGCMLCCNLIIYRFNHLAVSNPVLKLLSQADFSSINDQEGKYGKSSLNKVELDAYAVKLEYLMKNELIYLHQDLSLSKLAQLTRIQKHHVSQVLNLKLKMNFYEYVNGFRVGHACVLLKENSVDTLEHIAEQSGFNSKVSFNRHFKSVKGITPSDYRLTGTLQID
jgi:AraC-like DNA-binding protein